MKVRPRAVLFDLDGTLIDSAPDLAGACNELRIARGLRPLPLAALRPMVGAGARGMIGAGFGYVPDDSEFAPLRDEFLRLYSERMTRETRLFDDVAATIDSLQRQGLGWGIVTNKAARFAEPLIAWLGFARYAGAIVCGDTTPHAKPHPEPLLEAARRLGVEAGDCVYVGDDKRDVDAGRAAGMATLVAAWGYLGAGDPVEAWGADAIISTPPGLLTWLDCTAAASCE